MSDPNKIQFKSSQEIDGKQSLLLIDLTKFYCHEKNIIKFKNIVENKSKISLRLIDWFVTNFSKKNQTMYPIREYKDKEENSKTNQTETNSNTDNAEPIMFSDYFCVFSNYKGQLKSYHKRNFDPFCRNIRIHFYYDNNNFIITTVGQLNFFKWAIENNILNYIEQNVKVIEEDMNLIANIKNKSVNNKSCKKKTNKNDKNKSVKNNIINNQDSNNQDSDNQDSNDQFNNKEDNKDNGKDECLNNNVKKDNVDVDNVNETNGENSNENSNENSSKNKTSKSNKKIVVQKNNTQKKIVNLENKGTTRRKRRELSESASKSLIKHNCKTVITFD